MLLKGKAVIALVLPKEAGIRILRNDRARSFSRKAARLRPDFRTPMESIGPQPSEMTAKRAMSEVTKARGADGQSPRVTHFPVSVIDSARSEDESICGLRGPSMTRWPDQSIARRLMAFEAQ